MTIFPSGDLIASDQHGAIQIPIEVARILPKLAKEMEEYEHPMINMCLLPYRLQKIKLSGLNDRPVST